MSFAYVPPNYNPATSLDFEVMPRDSYGVPAHIPPDIGAAIQHTYHVPPSYYPFIKKLGDDSPELKPYTDKLIKGQLTFHDFECMFYHNCQPLKIFRKRIPLPHRTPEEIGKSDEVTWESKWYTLRQLYYCEFLSRYVFRDWMLALFLGLFSAQLWITELWIYRQDMKLFYLEAPEHKINWNVPRGDL